MGIISGCSGLSSSKLVVFIEYFLYPHDLIELLKHLSNYSCSIVVIDKYLSKYFEEIKLLNYIDSELSIHIVDNVLKELINYIDSEYDIDLTFIKPRTMFTLLLYLLNNYFRNKRLYLKTKLIVNSLILDDKILKQILRLRSLKPRNRVLLSICMEYRIESEISSFARVSRRGLYRYLREFREQGLIRSKRGKIELTNSGRELCNIMSILVKINNQYV